MRERTGWGDTQLRVHLTRLLELEYLLAHRGMRGQSFEYELAFDGDASTDAPHLTGLIDVAALDDPQSALNSTPTTASSRGSIPRFAPPTRPQNAPIAAPSRPSQMTANPAPARLGEETADAERKTHVLRPNGKHPSYVAAPSSSAAEVRQ